MDKKKLNNEDLKEVNGGGAIYNVDQPGAIYGVSNAGAIYGAVNPKISNDVDITGTDHAGGICGEAENAPLIKDCTNKESI